MAGELELSGGAQAEDDERQAIVDDKNRLDGLRILMETALGRRVLAQWLVMMRVFHPVAGDRQAGAQEAGMLLRDQLREAGPAYWRKLCEENDL